MSSGTDQEIVIDFNKIKLILSHRKLLILAIFIFVISVSIFISNLLPKKYESSAKLYINKTNSTFLSELNPYMVSDGVSKSGMAGFLGNGSSLGSEIEILKSSLVLNKVVIDNDLKYKDGKKAGQYLPGRSLVSEDLIIEQPKEINGSNIINISYKSTDPQFSYNIVNSIVKNYILLSKEINSQKALDDGVFLEQSIKEAKNELGNKINKFKQIRLKSNVYGNNAESQGLMALYDSRIRKNAQTVANSQLATKEVELEIEEATEKLKSIKEKYNWTSLLKKMSKDVSNVVILETPKLLEKNEYSANFNFIIVLSIFISIILSFFAVLIAETTSRTLTYSDYNEKTLLFNFKNPDNYDFDELKDSIFFNKINKITVISLVNDNGLQKFVRFFKENISNQIEVTSISDKTPYETILTHICDNENFIILTQIGLTNRKPLRKFRKLMNKFGNNILSEIIFN